MSHVQQGKHTRNFVSCKKFFCFLFFLFHLHNLVHSLYVFYADASKHSWSAVVTQAKVVQINGKDTNLFLLIGECDKGGLCSLYDIQKAIQLFV